MAFAPSKRRSRKREEAKVSLNSMMDMMTIILLFLLKSFSTSGQLMQQAPGINLPLSTSDKKPEQNMMVILAPDRGLVVHMEGRAFEEMPIVASMEELTSEVDVILPNLSNMIADRQASNASVNLPPLEEMTIQADEGAPYSQILKVIQTASEQGIATFDFVIQKTG